MESLKICILMGYFCQNYVIFELKKYRAVVLWKMTYDFINDKEFVRQVVESNADKSSVYVLALGMYLIS